MTSISEITAVGSLTEGTPTHHRVNSVSLPRESVKIMTRGCGTFVADTLTRDLTIDPRDSVGKTWSGLQLRGGSGGAVVRRAIAKPELLLAEHENVRDPIHDNDANIVIMNQGLGSVKAAEPLIESASAYTTVHVGDNQ